MTTMNLNELRIPTERDGIPLEDHGGWLTEDVEVYFREIERHLIEKIQEADYVFGCVAWLTHPDILAALAKKKGVCLVVQKEDFLRPDIYANDGWRNVLRSQYAALKGIPRAEFGDLIGGLSTNCGDYMDRPSAVRCVGNLNTNKNPAHPRAHHKFVVFANDDPNVEPFQGARTWTLTSAWTGSFNFTKNATLSLENAVVLRHPDLAEAFYQEFLQVAALSEPLDWQTPWSAPEWRIGT